MLSGAANSDVFQFQASQLCAKGLIGLFAHITETYPMLFDNGILINFLGVCIVLKNDACADTITWVRSVSVRMGHSKKRGSAIDDYRRSYHMPPCNASPVNEGKKRTFRKRDPFSNETIIASFLR